MLQEERISACHKTDLVWEMPTLRTCGRPGTVIQHQRRGTPSRSGIPRRRALGRCPAQRCSRPWPDGCPSLRGFWRPLHTRGLVLCNGRTRERRLQSIRKRAIRDGRDGTDLTLYEGQVVLLDKVMKSVLGEVCDGRRGSRGERQGKEL